MNHRIRRQVLELELPREMGAYALQRQVGLVFQEKIVPKLDELFSQLAPAGQILRIEHLEIDLGRLSESNWEQQLLESCLRQLTQQLQEIVKAQEYMPESSAQVLSSADNAFQILLAFLENGNLPWYAKGMQLSELEQLLQPLLSVQSPQFSREILPLLRQKNSTLRRLLWQFKPYLVAQILEAALQMPAACLAEAQQQLQKQLGLPLSLTQQEHLLRITLKQENIFHGSPPAALIAQLVSQWKKVLAPNLGGILVHAPANESNDFPDSISASEATPDHQRLAPLSQAKSDREPAPQATSTTAFKGELPGLGIDLAGIVLLGPYLPTFFQALDLLQPGSFSSIEAQFRAIHLLHYLATGQEHPEEPLLALPKILCGLALEEPVPAILSLEQSEIQEAESMLQALIRNWPALKSTSPDGLRSGFLQRQGILSRNEAQSTWLLRVERLGQDLLLERLPWSISVIKLPWMETSLQVEW
jgi:hypothetical protein